jgi:peptidoglycan-associated lipoprotein
MAMHMSIQSLIKPTRYSLNPCLNIIQPMLKVLIVCTLAFGMIGMSGCVRKKGYGADGAGADGGSVGDSMQFYGTNLTPEQERELLSRNTYYFGLDSYDVCDEDVMSIYAHAKKIICNNRCRVRVEGHTDERGSREYNVALGERRAKAVANCLMLKGVRPESISVVSYGKEKPAVLGHDESAWSQNRRAVIVYEGQ